MAAMKEGYAPTDFLVVEDPEKATTFHLQVKRHGKPDHGLMGAAFAALYKNYRGNSYEGPGKEEAKFKLRALYKSEGMDWPSETNSELGIVNSELRTQTANSPFTIHHSLFSQPRFVVLLSEPPATGLIRIPIAVTGTWAGAEKKFSMGLDDLNEIRENFAKKPTGEINVDYEHASEVPFGTGGPVLSAGRIVKLDEPEKYKDSGFRIQDSGEKPQSPSRLAGPQPRFILWGWYEPTDRARQLIANREYRYISPAIRWGAKDKVTGKTAGTVLTSVALVNKPFLEELPEIHLCEMQDSGFRIQGKHRAGIS